MEFLEYLELKTYNKPMCLNTYKGIKKKKYPKWQGWKVLKRLKAEKKPFESDYLDLLVYNFYLCQFIKENFLSTNSES
jgi:hypothetical protein